MHELFPMMAYRISHWFCAWGAMFVSFFEQLLECMHSPRHVTKHEETILFLNSSFPSNHLGNIHGLVLFIQHIPTICTPKGELESNLFMFETSKLSMHFLPGFIKEICQDTPYAFKNALLATWVDKIP